MVRPGLFVQGFYDDGGMPSRSMVEASQKVACSLALADYSTKTELADSIAHSHESERVLLLDQVAVHTGQPRPQKPADDHTAQRNQQQLLDLDWSSAIADGHTRPPPKMVSKKLKRSSGQGKAAVQAASSSSATGTPRNLASHGSERPARAHGQAEPAAGLSADAPDAASPRPCTKTDMVERPHSKPAQHADSAASSEAAVRPAGRRAGLGTEPGSQHATLPSPASAASESAAATDLSSLSEHVDSSASFPSEASSSAAHMKASEGMQHAGALKLPQTAETSPRLPPAARSGLVSARKTASQAGSQVGASPPDSLARDSHTAKAATVDGADAKCIVCLPASIATDHLLHEGRPCSYQHESAANHEGRFWHLKRCGWRCCRFASG